MNVFYCQTDWTLKKEVPKREEAQGTLTVLLNSICPCVPGELLLLASF